MSLESRIRDEAEGWLKDMTPRQSAYWYLDAWEGEPEEIFGEDGHLSPEWNEIIIKARIRFIHAKRHGGAGHE